MCEVSRTSESMVDRATHDGLMVLVPSHDKEVPSMVCQSGYYIVIKSGYYIWLLYSH